MLSQIQSDWLAAVVSASSLVELSVGVKLKTNACSCEKVLTNMIRTLTATVHSFRSFHVLKEMNETYLLALIVSDGLKQRQKDDACCSVSLSATMTNIILCCMRV